MKKKSQYDVAICTMVARENENLYEWVKYHSKLGIKNFIIYDNDFLKKEFVLDWVQSHKSSFRDCAFKVLDFTDVEYPTRQLEAFSNCCRLYLKNYDWILFSDIDEFLDLNGMTLYEWLESIPEEFQGKKVQGVILKWKGYGWNHQLFKTDEPLEVRCNQPVNYEPGFAKHVKSLIKGTAEGLDWKNPHVPSFVKNGIILQTTLDAEQYTKETSDDWQSEGYSPFNAILDVDKVPHLNHYWCKSLEEYLEKQTRGAASVKYMSDAWKQVYSLDKFKIYNGLTEEELDKAIKEYEAVKGPIMV